MSKEFEVEIPWGDIWKLIVHYVEHLRDPSDWRVVINDSTTVGVTKVDLTQAHLALEVSDGARVVALQAQPSIAHPSYSEVLVDGDEEQAARLKFALRGGNVLRGRLVAFHFIFDHVTLDGSTMRYDCVCPR